MTLNDSNGTFIAATVGMYEPGRCWGSTDKFSTNHYLNLRY